MANTTNLVQDFAKRTLRNLALIEALERVTKRDVDGNVPPVAAAFEVTQLVNSLYGIVILAHEKMGKDGRVAIPPTLLGDLRIQGWPEFDQSGGRDRATNLSELIAHLRHSFAHARFDYTPDARGEIEKISIKNLYNATDWQVSIPASELRVFVQKFGEWLIANG